MRSILLLGVNFLSIHKIVCVAARNHVRWEDVATVSCIGSTSTDWRSLVFVETHCHRWRMSSNLMWMIIHLENFLLLGGQIHRCTTILSSVLLPIHDSKSHGSWYENVVLVSDVLTTIIWRLNLSLMNVILLLILIHLLELLKLVLLRIFIAVVGYISTCLLGLLSINLALLIVAVKILNIQRSASLMVSQARAGTRF